MLKFSEVCKEVGYDPTLKRPDPVYMYYGYKNGEARCFGTKKEALVFSRNTETVIKNQAAIDAFTEKQRGLEKKACLLWRQKFREEYKYLTDAQFDIVYDKAWEQDHDAGRDEVYYCFDSLLEFCQDFKNA